jgi:hypothetical protein
VQAGLILSVALISTTRAAFNPLPAGLMHLSPRLFSSRRFQTGGVAKLISKIYSLPQ